ncbi:potassium-transporting ATPase subunit KdpC [Marmoricola sp. RAF53]|uniref:potassium-transporting ATPase subunit KdpC n=1 Tax=Marmoricola sp. RAF53 TaxID=3233059 RepID=UPI003F9D80F7
MFTLFLRQLGPAVRAVVTLTVLLGLAYPLALTGFAQAVVPGRADGSLLHRDGTVVGSSLIGQSFDGENGYFQSRPSAAGDGYDGRASGASNLGPESPDLLRAVADRRAAVAELEGTDPAKVPADALQASASGLDPDISPAYAALQVPRVARERGLTESAVRTLVAQATSERVLGFLGEPHVDVVELNLALDRAADAAD